jgi:hypothetical protein
MPPEGLLDTLKEDVAAAEIRAYHSVLRRWFAPTGGSLSIARVVYAAVIAILVLLTFSYGAIKIIRIYGIYTFTEESRQFSEDGGITSTVTTTQISGHFADEEEAKRVWQETRELKKAGRYERTFLKEIERNGTRSRIYEYRYTLSNGMVVAFGESEPVEEETGQ